MENLQLQKYSFCGALTCARPQPSIDFSIKHDTIWMHIGVFHVFISQIQCLTSVTARDLMPVKLPWPSTNINLITMLGS